MTGDSRTAREGTAAMAVERAKGKAGKPAGGKAGKPAPSKKAKAKKTGKKARTPAAAASKGRVSHSSALSRDEAIAYLEAVVGGLRSGSIRFRQGDRRVVLRPAERLTLTIKARDGGKKESIAFELSWRADDEDGTT